MTSLAATITEVGSEKDTLTVFYDGNVVLHIFQEPTGHAADYESALRGYGFEPVAFDGTSWTLETLF